MDLTTTYAGLNLKHPIVASSSPLSKDLEAVKRLAEGGAAAVVLFSLFEEQIRHERETLDFIIGKTTYHDAESLSYFPDFEAYDAGPGEYLELIYQATQAVDVPIIASLNGVTEHGWVAYAQDMVQAGAQAIELNVFFLPVDLETSGTEVEAQYVRIVEAVRRAVEVPIIVKLSPFFSATGHMARRLAQAGADGLALFNRFYQPDFDLETRTVQSRLELSQPYEIRLPLLWIALLHGKIPASLAATSGVAGAEEVLKYLLAGADAVYSASALLRNGEAYLAKILTDCEVWMEKHGFESVRQLKGSMAYANCAEPEAMVRANYLKMLRSYIPPSAAPRAG